MIGELEVASDPVVVLNGCVNDMVIELFGEQATHFLYGFLTGQHLRLGVAVCTLLVCCMYLRRRWRAEQAAYARHVFDVKNGACCNCPVHGRCTAAVLEIIF